METRLCVWRTFQDADTVELNVFSSALRRFEHEWLLSPSASHGSIWGEGGGVAFKVANEIRASLHLL